MVMGVPAHAQLNKTIHALRIQKAFQTAINVEMALLMLYMMSNATLALLVLKDVLAV